jgi:predicted DNA-binding transcriptional regulator AlpA
MTVEPRLISGPEAAAYCSVTVATWSKWVASGIMPKPVIGRQWDRKAIDAILDKASGIVAAAPALDAAEQAWEARYAAQS